MSDSVGRKADVELLYGVLGGGSIKGESGTKIYGQLTSIINRINNSGALKIKIHVDKSELISLQSDIETIIKKAGTRKVKSLPVSATNIANVERAAAEAAALGRAMSDATGKTAILEGALDRLASAQTAFQNSKQASRDVSALKAETAAVQKLINDYQKVQTIISTIKSGSWDTKISGLGVADDNKELIECKKILGQIKTDADSIRFDDTESCSALVIKAGELEAAFSRAKNASKDIKLGETEEIKWQKLTTQVEAYYARVKGTVAQSPEMTARLNNFVAAVRNGTSADFAPLRAQFLQLQSQLDKMGATTETLFQKFKKTFQGHFGTLLASSLTMLARRSFIEMYRNVVEIDDGMTELKKVTEETNATYERFLTNASARAQELGARVSDVVKATADFARLGYSLGEATDLSDAAVIYKNVGDGIENISDASESIISTMKAFHISAKDVLSIVDRLNAVGNTEAISSEGIGTALQSSASALAAARNSLEESIGLVVGANAVVQDPAKVGTALKTVSTKVAVRVHRKMIDKQHIELLENPKAYRATAQG